MLDLGKYAFEVSLAYAGSLLAIAVLVGVSIWQGRRARARLEAFEAEREQDH